MTKEILEQGKVLESKIMQLRAEIAQLIDMADEVKDTKIRVRVRGVDIELPKAVFKSEVNKEKNERESQLTLLESEFNAL